MLRRVSRFRRIHRVMGRRKTIYDIAELANTSPSAVSAVLNGSWEKRRISRDTANRVMAVAEEHGYERNIQASLLRRSRSNIVGMVIPKYDDRYFGMIAERFEQLARDRGLFPVITCTQRDGDLEARAARELVSYQVDTIIATGATDPDRITEICRAAGVVSINLDLPGSAAPTVISDNRGGAKELTALLLRTCNETAQGRPMMFVGGRPSDANTSARIDGFLEAHAEAGIDVPDDLILACGYAGEKAFAALDAFRGPEPAGLFVNSTISLEGVVRWLKKNGRLDDGSTRFACFDWDPFAALIPGNVGMARQDVPRMLDAVFQVLEDGGKPGDTVLVPCILEYCNDTTAG
ncbi:LacI family DNA-binding transcriptional regulator [Rhodobacterales bacterium HKCCE3408]|nr:LacI family DNA-binding transcriptional regulator [Rhodobacterales bacterium HKCCE3408]